MSTPHNIFRRTLLLTCSVLLFACAASPQTVAIKPALTAPSMPIGHNRPVRVETRDTRRDNIIGTQGGVYHSAYLSTDSDIATSINQAAVTVLQSWEFAAVPTTLGNDVMPVFTLEILDINYQPPSSSVGGNVTVKCRVGVKISKDGATYTGEYISKRSEQVVIMGTPAGRRRVVNETVNQALNEVFLDSKLQRFMAR